MKFNLKIYILHETTVQRLNGEPNWIRFGHHSRSEDGIETEAVFPGAIRLLKRVDIFLYQILNQDSIIKITMKYFHLIRRLTLTIHSIDILTLYFKESYAFIQNDIL